MSDLFWSEITGHSFYFCLPPTGESEMAGRILIEWIKIERRLFEFIKEMKIKRGLFEFIKWKKIERGLFEFIKWIKIKRGLFEFIKWMKIERGLFEQLLWLKFDNWLNYSISSIPECSTDVRFCTNPEWIKIVQTPNRLSTALIN